MNHIVWDWNGTLLDDLAVVVAAVNDTHAVVGRRPITIEEYGAHYTRPVLLFYERLLNWTIEESEWKAFDGSFHVSYRRRVHSAGLATDAVEALEAARDAGLSQSLLSMYWHVELITQVDRFELARFLMRIDGLRGIPGDRKQVYLQQHLAAVGQDLAARLAPGEVLVVGDALDDAAAARALGLPPRGLHARE